MPTCIGVLAMQGAFDKHIKALCSLGVKTILVKTEKDLSLCDGLIIPGGESTTITKQIHFAKLHQPLIEFSKSKPILGTCAGAILMSKKLIDDGGVTPLGLMDITTTRNAYGRQNDSFEAPVSLSFSSDPFHAIFIRAPKITSCSDTVNVIASFNDEAIFVQEGHLFAATFHPELSDDTRVHEHFAAFTTQMRS